MYNIRKKRALTRQYLLKKLYKIVSIWFEFAIKTCIVNQLCGSLNT